MKRFVVTRELVDDPAAELQKILADPQQEERIVARAVGGRVRPAVPANPRHEAFASPPRRRTCW